MIAELSIHDTNRLCQYYLHCVYEEIERQLSSIHARVMSEKHGEVLYAGVTKILSAIRLTEQDIFYDLGSGFGKIVLQVFFQSNVKEVCGIEINSDFYKLSMLASQRVQKELPDFFKNRKLTLLSGDFLETPLASATVIFINSMCFNPVLLNQITNMLNQLPGVHTVVSLRPMANLKNLTFRKAIRIECSWDAALCYIYQKDVSVMPAGTGLV